MTLAACNIISRPWPMTFVQGHNIVAASQILTSDCFLTCNISDSVAIFITFKLGMSGRLNATIIIMVHFDDHDLGLGVRSQWVDN